MNQENRAGGTQAAKPALRAPWLEWVAASVGLLLVVSLFGVIGWQAFNEATTPPAITVKVENLTPVDGGYRVLFRASNTAGEAAAQVEIEGTVSPLGGPKETSRVVLDYIPGHSAHRGGLFFSSDPRSGTLALRATGFAEP